MYTIAAKFASSQEARRVYTVLNGSLKKLDFDAHVSRLRRGNDSYVHLIYDGEESQIPSEVIQTIHRLLGQGRICQLPPEALAAIEQRRKDQQKRQRERDLQEAFRKDPAAYLAALEERWLNASKNHPNE
jgi:hypothetical protein